MLPTMENMLAEIFESQASGNKPKPDNSLHSQTGTVITTRPYKLATQLVCWSNFLLVDKGSKRVKLSLCLIN
jgi:hypothetical protein